MKTLIKKLNHPVTFALLAYALCFAATGYLAVFTDTLFLSTFTPAWLPTFYLVQTPIVILSVVLMAPFIREASQNKNIILMLICGLIIFISYFILNYQWKWYVYLFCLSAVMIKALLITTCINVVSVSFDMRNYKKNSNKLTVFSQLGTIVSGFTSPLFTKVIGFAQFPILISLVFVMFALNIVKLIPQVIEPEVEVSSKKNYQYPIFVYIIALVSLAFLVMTLVEYLQFVEVSKMFHRSGIADYFGYYVGGVGVLCLIVQVFVASDVLRRFGIFGVLAITPLMVVVCSIIFIIYPNLITATILMGCANVGSFSLVRLGTEIVINILPRTVRRSAALYNRGISVTFGKVIGAIILFIFIQMQNSWLAVMCIIIAVIWYVISARLFQEYITAVRNFAKTHRFNISSQDLLTSPSVNTQQVIISSLTHNEAMLVRLGFAMLEKTKVTIPDNILLPHLKSPHVDIRLSAIKQIISQNSKDHVPQLLQTLLQEQDDEVIWLLTEAVYFLDPESAIPYAVKALQSKSNYRRISALLLVFSSNDAMIKKFGEQVLQESFNSKNEETRALYARVLAKLPDENAEEKLLVLLQDPSVKVVINAIAAISIRGNKKVIPRLMELLKDNIIRNYAADALIKFSQDALPYIQKQIEDNPSYQEINQLTRCLASIELTQVEDLIINSANSENEILRNLLAKNLLNTALKYQRSKIFSLETKKVLCNEISEAVIFLQAEQSEKELFIINECKARFYWGCYRILTWLAVYFHSEEIIQIVPVLLDFQCETYTHLKRANALEFLEHLVQHSPEFSECINVFEFTTTAHMLEKISKELKQKTDAYKRFYFPDEKDTHMQDLRDVLLILREVALFKNLPAEILYAIANVIKWREVGAGDFLFYKGDVPDNFYIVVSGEISVAHGDILLNTYQRSGYFGEVSLIGETARSADAKAIKDSILLYIDRVTFNSLLLDFPEVLHQVTKQIVVYLQQNLSRGAN